MSTATLNPDRSPDRNSAGNWRRFNSFAWFERPADADEFCIVYTHNRDSDSIDRANAITIAEALLPWIDGDAGDVIEQDHSHWACGWIKGYAIRVYRDGQETEAWQAWLELQSRIADYPLLDEFQHSEVFIEDCCQSWGSWASYDFERELKATWGDLATSGEALFDLFESARERVNADWEEDSGGPYLTRDVSEIASAVTADEIGAFLG